jgi:hypothetical protein
LAELEETGARRHQELLVQADPVAVAESVATAETATAQPARTARTAVTVALQDSAAAAAQPHLEWPDQVVLADLAAMAVTVD